MAEVALEATIVAEAQTESRLGRMLGLSVSIKDEKGAGMSIGRYPRPLMIDESKVTVIKSGG
jgi:hypothetical protein